MVRTQASSFLLLSKWAVNKDPDYSAAYIVFSTSDPDIRAHSMTFTNGVGNDVVCLAIETLAKTILGKSLAELTEDMSRTWRSLVSGQFRWIGPEVCLPTRLRLPLLISYLL